jgi:predicted ATPase
VRTVESHVSSLLRKLGVADRRELATVAGQRGAAGSRAGRFVGAPAVITTFVGRAQERAAVLAALQTSRLVTLLGPGGVGKTRLALAAAEEAAAALPGGAVFVDLVPVRDAFLVAAIAGAVGVPERPGEPLQEVLFEALRGSASLLVLDNCEHVLDAAAPFVDLLLARCPDVRVLATSRERLGVPGETTVAVPPLSLDGEAATLFVDRAHAADASFEQDPAIVAELCARLDGMPLAIELAAARSASLGLDGLLAALDDRLQVLRGGRNTAERHRSMRAVIEWSHDLLDDEERAVFRRLGVFAGGFDLAGASEVGGGDTMRHAVVADVVGRLVDKSLLVRRGDRWRLLETVRAYALERLAESGEDDEAFARHRAWCTRTAETIEQRMDGGDAWTDAFDDVVDDLRVSLATAPAGPGPDAVAYRLARSTAHLLYARRDLAESQSSYEDAAARAPTDGDAGAALLTAAEVGYARMRLDLSFGLAVAAGERFERAGDRARAASAFAWAVAEAERGPGEFPEPVPYEQTRPLFERARSLAPPGDDLRAAELLVAEMWLKPENRPEADPDLAERAVEAARAVGDVVLLDNALDGFSAAMLVAGRLRDAYENSLERLQMLDQFDPRHPRFGGEIIDIFHMGMENAVAAGELRDAKRIAELVRRDEIGKTLPFLTTSRMVVPLALLGEFDAALREAESMYHAWERAGSHAASWMNPAAAFAAMVSGVRGDDAGTQRWLDFAKRLSRRPREEALSPFIEARIALHRGDARRAYDCFVIVERVGHFYDAYGYALQAEAAVAAGAADADAHLAAARRSAAENPWAAASLDRARGRAGDRDALERALDGFDTVGARFEWAVTAVMLGGDVAAQGESTLAELGCEPPVS